MASEEKKCEHCGTTYVDKVYEGNPHTDFACIKTLAARVAELEGAYRDKCLQTERWLDACVDIANGHMDTAGCVQRAVDALK